MEENSGVSAKADMARFPRAGNLGVKTVRTMSNHSEMLGMQQTVPTRSVPSTQRAVVETVGGCSWPGLVYGDRKVFRRQRDLI